jgi:hypothetical protein
MLEKLATEKLAQGLVDIYNGLEQEMLINIGDKLKGTTDLLEKDPKSWQLQQLQNLGILDKQNLSLIKKQAGLTSAELNKILYQAGLDGLDETDTALKKALKIGAGLVVPLPISESPIILNILKAYQDQAANVLNLTNQTMLKSSKKVYTDIINKTTTDVLAGYKTPMQAMRDTVGMFADQGIPALIDKAGRKWGPEGYVRTVIVSTMHNTVHALQDQRMKEWGVDLVEVSSHSGARPLCAPYQGKIYKLHGRDKQYPNLYTDTSYGQPAGLFGINCHHTKYPFIEGVSTQTYFPYPKEENEKAYKESQVQRAHERTIRNAKTRYEMYKSMGDKDGMEKASTLIKNRQGKLRDFIDETGRTRRRDREQIVKNTISSSHIPNSTSPGKEVIKGPKKTYKKKDQIPDPSTIAHIPQTIAQPEPVNNHQVGDQVTFKLKGKETQGQIVGKDEDFVQIYHSNGKTSEVHENAIINNHGPVPKSEQTKANTSSNKVKGIQVGDKLTFKDMWGETKTGEIKSKSDSGYDVYDGSDTHFVEDKDIIKHTPQSGGNGNWSPATFKQLNSSDVDILKDRETFEKMPQEEVAIVHKYTTSYYSKMNGFLRTGADGSQRLAEEVEFLQETIKKNAKPMTENVKLFRKFNQRAINTVFGEGFDTLMMDAVREGDTSQAALEVKNKLIGGAFEDKGFVSSTYVQGSFGSSSDVNIDIFVPQGYDGGMFVESVSAFSHEKEYLFNSGVLFDIQDIDFSNQQIVVKVIPRIPTANQ